MPPKRNSNKDKKKEEDKPKKPTKVVKNKKENEKKEEPKKENKKEHNLPDLIFLLGGPPPGFPSHNDDGDSCNCSPKRPKKRKRETFEDDEDYPELEPKKKKEKLESLKKFFDFTKYEFKNFDNFVEFIRTVVYIWDKKFHSKAELCRMKRLLPVLEDMNLFIGNEVAKKNIIKLVINHLLKINYLEGDEDDFDKENSEAGMMHSVFMGPPGTGKTDFAKLVGKVFVKLGLLSDDSKFIVKRRDDFIAGYLGQTALKTRKVLNEAIGNILFIDEAYSLGCGRSDKDSFSKETIDLLVEFMSEHKNDTAIFFAGYKSNLEKDLFNANPGLERRVAWRFNFNDYKADDLSKIFKIQAQRENWNIEKEIGDKDFFETNNDYFKNNGGDTENLFAKCKMVNSLRKFVNRYFDPQFKKEDLKKCSLNNEDIENGLKCHIDNYNNDTSRTIKKEILENMFL
jgi:hypothetical protein